MTYRNNADTVWMKERQIEAMYRDRFDERRHAAEALDRLSTELVAGRDTAERAWLFAVGRPRVRPTTTTRWDRDEARRIFEDAAKLSLAYAQRQGIAYDIELEHQRHIRPKAYADNFRFGRLENWTH